MVPRQKAGMAARKGLATTRINANILRWESGFEESGIVELCYWGFGNEPLLLNPHIDLRV